MDGTLERSNGAMWREKIKQMARETPDGLMSCPSCGASVKGRNLVRHWDGAHAVGGGTESLERAEGHDPRAAVLWFFAAVVIIPLAIGLDELLGVGRAVVLAALAASGFGFLVALAAEFLEGFSRAQLNVRGAGLDLGRRLWPGTRLDLPVVRLTAGVANDSVGGTSSATNPNVVPQYREWNEGMYLDLRFARGRVLVHCREQGLGKFRQRWALPEGALGAAKKRYWAHIRLKRADFERLEVWLAEHGALERRT